MRHAYRWVLIAALMALPLAAAAQQAFTIRAVEVFAGPSSQYPLVATLPPNAGVRITGCLGDWSWCDVIFSNYRGWMYAADLAVPYQNDRVVVVDYGPQLSLTVVTFSLHTYWDRHYRGQPWYREREQWASRVQIEGDRGGPPPKGRSSQAERARPQQGQPSPKAGPPPDRSAKEHGVPEAGRAAPGAGGKPPEAKKQRPEGARPKDEGARGGG